jgi:hypothetical protein
MLRNWLGTSKVSCRDHRTRDRGRVVRDFRLPRAGEGVVRWVQGPRLGAVWEAQKTVVTLTGNLAACEARALLVWARVAEFAPVRLVFA